MAGAADLVIRVLADTSGAQSNVNALIQTLGKAAGVGAGAGVAGGMVAASMEIQDAMARVQTAYNSTDFTPGTARYQAAQEAILKFSTTTATSFSDAAAVYAQGARFINEAGQKLDPTQLNEYTDTMLRLSKVSSDQLSPVDIGQRIDVLSKLFGTSNFAQLGSEVSGLSGMHNKGEGPGLDAAIAIGQVGADIGVTQEQALAVGNYMADLGLGGQMGGSSIGRLMQRMSMGVETTLDPEQQYSDVKKQRDATEKLGDLQNQLAVAEQRRQQMYGQHGLKTAFKRDPAAVMAADNEIAKLQREIGDQSQDISHLSDGTAGSSRGSANVGAMADLLGEDKGTFAQEFQTDPLGVLLKWTHALSQLPETQRLSAMTKAFGGRGAVNVRDQKIIAALANPDRQGSLDSYIAEATGQAANPNDLNPRSDIITGTTSAKVTDLANALFGEAGAAGNGPRQLIDAAATQMLKTYGDNTAAVNKLNETLSGNPLIGTITTGVVSGVAMALPLLASRLLGGGAAGAVAGGAGSAAGAAAGGAGSAVATAAGAGTGAAARRAASLAASGAPEDWTAEDLARIANGGLGKKPPLPLDMTPAVTPAASALGIAGYAAATAAPFLLADAYKAQHASDLDTAIDDSGRAYAQRHAIGADLGSSTSPHQVDVGGITVNVPANVTGFEALKADVLKTVGDQLQAAWNAAHQGTPVSGALGGQFATGSAPR